MYLVRMHVGRPGRVDRPEGQDKKSEKGQCAYNDIKNRKIGKATGTKTSQKRISWPGSGSKLNDPEGQEAVFRVGICLSHFSRKPRWILSVPVFLEGFSGVMAAMMWL